MDEEERHADSGDGLRGGLAARDDEGAGGGEDHADDEVAAVDGGERKAGAGEAVEGFAGEHAEGSGDEGERGNPAARGEGEVALVLQMAGSHAR